MNYLLNENRLDKREYETRWSRQLADTHLSKEDYQLWRDYRSVDRVTLSLGTKIVHWQRKNGEPTIVSSFVLQSANLSDGSLKYTFDRAGENHIVDNVPRVLADTEVFVWVPFFNEVRHIPGNWDMATQPGYTTVGLCVWQRTNPTKIKANNHSYVTTLKVFAREWQNKDGS